jgi:NAD(P)-dependent dehydrogenase (short-subunit alcohol dehydrogenase family)
MDQDTPIPPLALITGAARRLGSAMAVTLARRGYAIALHYYHSADDARALAATIRETGVSVYPISANLTCEEEIDHLFDAIANLPNRLQVLVNSAALMRPGRLDVLSSKEWDEVMALNLKAPFICTKKAIPLMEQGKGLVVNIIDAGWDKAWTGYGAYIVSKAGLESLTRLQARTYAPGIRVNGIAPGLILPPDDLPEVTWQKLVEKTPLKRSGTLDEVCQVLNFLLENSYITGQIIYVDGGFRLGG